MFNELKFLVVIPARGGSKGIPGKNIIEVNNKPLIQYTIDAAMKSKYIDKIVVSTDDKEIAEVSIRCGAEVPFLRPGKLATDVSRTIDSVIYTLNNLPCIHIYDYLILLQPTQPLRQAFHIDEAIETIIKEESASLVSVTKVKEHPILIRTLNEEGQLQPLLNIQSTIRRQEFPNYYKVNGAIYINKLDKSFDANISFNDNKLAYIMDEKYDLDIDEPIDLELLKLKLKLI
ncbi:cytidylyltransferase domain-containing protein [Chryseomicrobium palamuruense]|uniref:Cytidylyltransferase domain-containing protein n=1 Tax=Chryseomicrobium palamuruense TaxID=682973 RepID=A0ABV8UTP5_9BACL